MMKTIRAAVVVLLACSLLPAAPARAQTGKALLGSVLPDYPPDLPDWSVQVSAEARGSGRLPRSPFNSAGTIYFYQIDPSAVVSFIFSRAYYRTIRSLWVPVTTDLSSPYRIFPDVTLHRIRRRRDTASASPPAGGAPLFRTASYDPRQQGAPQQGARQQGAQQDTQRQVQTLRAELEEQAELARASGTADIFQFNLEVYEDVYRADEDAALKQEVTRFKGDPAYKDVAAAPPERAELYDKIVRRDRGEPVAIDADQLIGIADDPNASPSVRQSAVRAMGTDSTPAARERFLNFLRLNSKPASGLHVTSLIQLIKIGTAEDKNNILKTLTDANDPLSTQAIITAIEATGWATGRQALRSISTLESAPRAVRDSAASTLDRLEGARGGVSPEALLGAVGWDYTRGTIKFGPRDFRGQSYPGRNFWGVPGSQWVTLSGPLRDARAYLDVKKGERDVQLTLKLEGATNLSPGDRLVLWAVTPDGKSVRLGQTATTQPAQSLPFQIDGHVSLEKFGLLVTVEKGAAAASPSGERVALIP